MEQPLAGQVRDDRVVDLQQEALSSLGATQLGGTLLHPPIQLADVEPGSRVTRLAMLHDGNLDAPLGIRNPPAQARPHRWPRFACHTGVAVFAFLAFISLGLPDGVLGVAWPSVRRTFDLP